MSKKSMFLFSRIVLTDVHYSRSRAVAAGLVIAQWDAGVALQEYVHRGKPAEEYVPGEFYLRELPHLLDLLATIPVFDCVVVDAHVWLQKDRPGCGYYLWQSLGERVPVIGVAKKPFHQGVAKPLLRGESKKPLYVSSVGLSTEDACSCIAQMSGPYRIPSLLKRVDQLSRWPT